MPHPSAPTPGPATTTGMPPVAATPVPPVATAPSETAEIPAALRPLLEALATQLAPFFLQATAGNAAAAQAAARDLLTQTPLRSTLQLLLTAQSIGFSLAALGTLGRSMQPDTPAETVADLTISAEKLGRAADRAHRALLQPRRRREPEAVATPPAPQHPASPVPPIQPTPKAFAASRAELPAADWGSVFAHVASEFADGLPTLPPTLRRPTSVRAAALSSTAGILTAQPLPQPPR